MKGATGTLRHNTLMWFRGVLAYVSACFDRKVILCVKRTNPLQLGDLRDLTLTSTHEVRPDDRRITFAYD